MGEELDLQHLEDLVGPRTKLVSLAHVSNTLGSVLDVDRVVRAAEAIGAKVLLDSCQSVPHMAVDVQALGAACEYLPQLGMDAVHQYENEIGAYLYEQLAAVDGVRIYGPPPSCDRGRAALAAFDVDGLHAADISMVLDTKGSLSAL